MTSSCAQAGSCGGDYTDPTGQRAMGYYDQDFLNYYYYMASQFAVSDRWFSPVSSKSIDNRIATFTGGTTQGLVHDPGGNDKLSQLDINNIFEELDQAGVSWKIYYSVTQGFCVSDDDCPTTGNSRYPATDFSNLSYSFKYLYNNPNGNPCTAPTVPSSAVGDDTNSFCIDPTHIAPLSQYYTDLTNNTLPSFAFIEAGYANNDEHPGSEQSILDGQQEMAKIIGALMSSSSWSSSVFFFSYDEGGGPYDHVPPVPGHSNDNTDASLGAIPDISSIAVNADSYNPCVPPGGTPTLHCDLVSTDPGANPGDAPAQQGFAAQLGFRLPNIVISPFTRKHYVSHVPMDHTAVIKFVENRFIGSSAHLTARDAAQPNLLDFFDFTNVPWATPPSPPTPLRQTSQLHTGQHGPVREIQLQGIAWGSHCRIAVEESTAYLGDVPPASAMYRRPPGRRARAGLQSRTASLLLNRDLRSYVPRTVEIRRNPQVLPRAQTCAHLRIRIEGDLIPLFSRGSTSISRPVCMSSEESTPLKMNVAPGAASTEMRLAVPCPRLSGSNMTVTSDPLTRSATPDCTLENDDCPSRWNDVAPVTRTRNGGRSGAALRISTPVPAS